MENTQKSPSKEYVAEGWIYQVDYTVPLEEVKTGDEFPKTRHTKIWIQITENEVTKSLIQKVIERAKTDSSEEMKQIIANNSDNDIVSFAAILMYCHYPLYYVFATENKTVFSCDTGFNLSTQGVALDGKTNGEPWFSIYMEPRQQLRPKITAPEDFIPTLVKTPFVLRKDTSGTREMAFS